MILLQAEVLELKADPHRQAKGTVVEAKIERGRGPVATGPGPEWDSPGWGRLRRGNIQWACPSAH